MSKHIPLTSIGQFGRVRAARPDVPQHLHTGIDIIRPHLGFATEKVLAASNGKVLSVRTDGPFAQIIIEHPLEQLWTVYEHVSGIAVNAGQTVFAGEPIARLMDELELKTYGMKFNHLHFEVIRVRPRALMPTKALPQRYFGTYGLECITNEQLYKTYYDPVEFLKNVAN